jgi:hypothetical protein
MTSVIGLIFLPMAQFAWCLLSNCSLLKALHPDWLPDKMEASPGLSSSVVSGFFFRFKGG